MAVVSLADMRMFSDDFCLLPEFFEFICGEWLGTGQYRKVYVYKPDPTLVIKFEQHIEKNEFANAIEFQNYHQIGYNHPALQKYLAPCHSTSGGGRILLQRRCEPINLKKLPTHLPEFFGDIKSSNWGMLKGKVVCFDYANTFLWDQKSLAKLKKVTWK